MRERTKTVPASLLTGIVLLSACGEQPLTQPAKLKVGMLVAAGVEDEAETFNRPTLEAVQKAAIEADLEFTYVNAQSVSGYGRGVDELVAGGTDLVVTLGFEMGDATANAARKYPDLSFVIVDQVYYPGFGCAADVESCYTEEGGLSNVTSLVFAEDEVGYLAGVLAGCMSQTGKVATVAGMEIPTVTRYVIGFQNGALSVNPEIITFNQYIPDFNDPGTGGVVAEDFIRQGADVIFGVGGNDGNGGLLAAKEAGRMGIGVDVDQYLTYPEIRDVLLTSAVKNMHVAAADAVREFAAGTLVGGVRASTLATGAVGLAPFHDWEEKVSQDCKDKIRAAEETIKADPAITGAKDSQIEEASR